MIKKFWPQTVLFFLVLTIAATNYSPATWLSGWDNLHPEFNFLLNIKRSIFAVWEEYQGLGLLGGMGHAADLPRQVILWFASLIIPSQLLRYFYHFLMLFVGILGIYSISKDYMLVGYEQNTRVKGSVLAAVYYLLNLGTIQYFYVPFEPYSTFWGLFPLEIYVLIRYLNDSSKKNLVLLSLVNLLAVPQGYVQTIFLVYIVCTGIFVVFNLLRKRSFHSLAVSFKTILVILTINAFWLLPTFYFMKKNFLVNRNAAQNYMATDKFFQMNKRRGTISDFIYLKEFYYDFIDYDHVKGDFDYMMTGWRRQFSQNSVSVIGLLFFIVICLGLFKKSKYRIELTTLFTLSGIFFLSDTYLISLLNDALRQIALTDQLFRNPFTKFIVPTVFTFSLLFGIGGAWLIDSVRKIDKKFFSKIIFLFLLISFAYIYYPAWRGDFIYKLEKTKIPSEYFQLFDYLNKQTDKGRIANFPQSNIWGWVYYKWGITGSGFAWYAVEQPFLDRAFDVWSDKNENYYWEMSNAIYSENLKLFSNLIEKYQIRWFLIDENVFSYTHYKGLNIESLKLMLSSSGKIVKRNEFGKLMLYEIKLDNSPKDFVFLASDLPVVGPEYKWNNYDRAFEENGNYVSIQSQKSKVKSQNYNSKVKSEEKEIVDVYYPFRSLFTGRKQEELEFGVEDTRLRQGFGGQGAEYFSFTTKIPKELAGGKLVLPELVKDEVTEYDAGDLKATTKKLPEVYLDGEVIKTSSASSEITLDYIKQGNLEVRVPKINGYYSYQLSDFSDQSPKSCDQFNKGIYTHERVRPLGISRSDPDLLRLTSLGSSNCLDFDLPNLTQRLGYLITVENGNIDGKSLLFAVINKNSQRSDIETYLPKRNSALSTPGESLRATPGVSLSPSASGVNKSYFIIPPMEDYAVGYNLHFDNISIGRVKTVNDLGKITVNPIPYRFLTSLKIVTDSTFKGSTLKGDIKVDHPNPSFYQITLDSSTIGGVHSATPEVSSSQTNNMTLVLSQSFDSGWKAYEISCKLWVVSCKLEKFLPFLFGKEIKNHVLVNNWENGWKIQPTSNNLQPTTIILVYLPQYLEYIGFGLLLLTPLLLVGKRKFV